MFEINETTGAIAMSGGDTGGFTITPTVEGQGDTPGILLFSVKNSAGVLLISRQYPMVSGEPIDIEFGNADTDSWPAGMYSWDVRGILNPMFDGEEGDPDRHVVDGDQVLTPRRPMSLTIVATVGKV